MIDEPNEPQDVMDDPKIKKIPRRRKAAEPKPPTPEESQLDAELARLGKQCRDLTLQVYHLTCLKDFYYAKFMEALRGGLETMDRAMRAEGVLQTMDNEARSKMETKNPKENPKS